METEKKKVHQRKDIVMDAVAKKNSFKEIPRVIRELFGAELFGLALAECVAL